jgi:hypothetical protein
LTGPAYPERMSLLADRARALSGSGDLDSVLSELYRGERFQREMAVCMAIVAGHRPTPSWHGIRRRRR